jgi:hypothetical protein
MKAERGGTLAEIIHVQGYSIITTNLIRGENTSRPVRDIVGRQLVGNAAPRRFPGISPGFAELASVRKHDYHVPPGR